MSLYEPRLEDDGALIAAYRRGDDAALSRLVERHQSQVYRLALGLLSSPEEAEDAAQEALIAMIGSLPRFRGESRFSTWLYRLTLNGCLNRRKRKAGRRETPLPPEALDLPAPPDGQVDVQVGRLWLRERVGSFLSALSDGYRAPVVLSDALNLPASEIASVLGISLPAVKARILRGRRRLRAEVQHYCEENGLSGWRELVSD